MQGAAEKASDQTRSGTAMGGVCTPEALCCIGNDETGRGGVITCMGLEASRDHRWYVFTWPCGFCEAHYKSSTWTVGWCHDYTELGESLLFSAH